MQITNINYAWAVYLALIEGLSLVVLDVCSLFPVDEIAGLFVGFIPVFLILLLYRLSSDYLPLKINGKEITEIPLLYVCILNALFIEVAFLIQGMLPSTSVNTRILITVLSFLLSPLMLLLIYNNANVKLRFDLNNKSIKINKVGLSFAIYACFVELIIAPLMYVLALLPSFFNGLISGFVGGLIGVFVMNIILERKPFEIIT